MNHGLPRSDRLSVAFRHRPLRKPIDRRNIDGDMLRAEPRHGRIGTDQTVGDNGHHAPRPDFVLPCVDTLSDTYGKSKFFHDLPDEAGRVVFARFRAAARQFPFIPFIAKNNDATWFKQHALDRHQLNARRQNP